MKHCPGFRRATPATCGNSYKSKERILKPPWVRYRAGHGEIGACFGGRKFPLSRASPGPPISRCLNLFAASRGDFRAGSSTKICLTKFQDFAKQWYPLSLTSHFSRRLFGKKIIFLRGYASQGKTWRRPGNRSYPMKRVKILAIFPKKLISSRVNCAYLEPRGSLTRITFYPLEILKRKRPGSGNRGEPGGPYFLTLPAKPVNF